MSASDVPPPAGPRWRRFGLAAAGAALTVTGLGLAQHLDPAVEVARVAVPRSDDALLPALRLRPRAATGERLPTALLAHGVTASKESLLRLGEELARAGYECLTFDFPGHGASREAFRRGRLVSAIGDAARTLSPDARVDVFVGHSMGADVGQRAVERGLIDPRLFVALGARTTLEPTPERRVVLITGRYDPLVPPAALRRVAPPGAAVVIAPDCAHALEPYSPAVARAVVAAAREAVGGARVPPSEAWQVRLLGLALLVVGGLLLAGAALPPPEAARRGRPRRALAGATPAALLLLPLGLGVDAAWFHALPSPLDLPLALLVVAAAGLVSVGAGRLAGRVPRCRARAASWGQAGLLGLLLLAGLGLALSGGTLYALLLAFLAALTGVGLLLGLAAGRRAGDAAAHAAFAVWAGLLPALWLALLW